MLVIKLKSDPLKTKYNYKFDYLLLEVLVIFDKLNSNFIGCRYYLHNEDLIFDLFPLLITKTNHAYQVASLLKKHSYEFRI